MANVIKHKRGSGNDPAANNLVIGELAIRTDTGKLFTKMDSGAIAEIAGGGSDIAINTLSSSSGTGGGSATFNGSAYRFTLSAPPSVSAAQLLVSINGVIQKPVTGTGQPSEGFAVDGNDIILGDAPETGADFFILTFKSLGVSEPADNSVTSAKIADGAIVNADINASAAIAGTKISPNFGSQAISTTGGLSINGATVFNESGANVDFRVEGDTDTNLLLIDASHDRVGIGATLPEFKLDVNGEIASKNSSKEFIALNLTNNEARIKSSFYSGASGAYRPITFFTSDSEAMRIDTSGKVGIGTTSPDQKVHIKDSSANPLLLVERGSGARSFIEAQTDKGAFGTGNNYPVYFIQNSGSAMIIDTSKNIILTSNTTSKGNIDNGSSSGAYFNTAGQLNTSRATTSNSVHVNFNNPNNTVGTITTSGTSTSFNTSGSDRTLKKNFEVWNEDILSIFKNINPQKFNFICEDDSIPKTKGFIAQDLVDYFPEAYPKNDETDKYWFNPSGMVVYLMKAIKELQAKVEALEAK